MFAPFFLVSSLAVATAATSVTIEDCPSGLTRDNYLQVFDDSCFRFELYQHRTYLDAETQCEKDGGTLALVKSKDMNVFIVRQLLHFRSRAPVWIGLNDKKNENNFVWEDGTSLGNGYTNWGYQEGPHSTFMTHHYEDCVTLDPIQAGQWQDQQCEPLLMLMKYEFAFVCQYKVQAKTTKAPPSTTVRTQTSTVKVHTSPATKATCSVFVCDKDCGLGGYKIGQNGCVLCECDE